MSSAPPNYTVVQGQKVDPGRSWPMFSGTGLTLRLQKELEDNRIGIEVDANTNANANANPHTLNGVGWAAVDENWRTFEGEIEGPADTPYEGGAYRVELTVPDEYPAAAPTVRFLTRVWHPNINPLTGASCVNFGAPPPGCREWNATMTLRDALISIRELLANPESPETGKSFDRGNEAVAKQYREDRATFEATARHWTAVYAGGPVPEVPALMDQYTYHEARVSHLVEIGNDEHSGRYALSTHNWNVEQIRSRSPNLLKWKDPKSANQKNMSMLTSTPRPRFSPPQTITADASVQVEVPVAWRSRRTALSEAKLTLQLQCEFHASANANTTSEGDEEDGVRLATSWRTFEGEIDGPPDTPYEGGKFKVELIVPEEYPVVAPTVKFLTRVWHPNINPLTGETRVDFWGRSIQVIQEKIPAPKDLRTVLISLRSMLANADSELDHCLDKKMAKQIQENPITFEVTARHWTVIYAGSPALPVPEYEDHVSKMMEMGIDEHTARYALAAHSWDIKLAEKYAFASLSSPSPD